MIVPIEDVIVAFAFVAMAPILTKNAFAHSGHHYHHHYQKSAFQICMKMTKISAKTPSVAGLNEICGSRPRYDTLMVQPQSDLQERSKFADSFWGFQPTPIIEQVVVKKAQNTCQGGGGLQLARTKRFPIFNYSVIGLLEKKYYKQALTNKLKILIPM